VDIDYPEDVERFRRELRSLLASHLPHGWAGAGALDGAVRVEFIDSWRRFLADHGLLAVSWPTEYGGGGLSELEQVVLAEELALAGAPEGGENDVFGIRLLGNTIVAHGSEEQKAFFLPRILSGEHRWCQGYSEPDAGSDLAALRTIARLRDGEWVIDGQKIWTSVAQTANWIFVLARTDPAVPKHGGISFLLVPMDQPGVEVRPIRNAAGYDHFCEVFFAGATTAEANVLGPVNGGWNVAMTLLGYERGMAATTDPLRYGSDISRLVELARERRMTDDPGIRPRLAWCRSRVELMRYRGFSVLTRSLIGDQAGADGAVSKLIWSEFFQSYTELALDILGPEMLAPEGPGNGGALRVAEHGTPNTSSLWVEEYLHARASTIYAGSTQIQRNVIAERMLGLPKERG
jgi:alkylation response protein AidB-like acyl-CoA dehydrogenase